MKEYDEGYGMYLNDEYQDKILRQPNFGMMGSHGFGMMGPHHFGQHGFGFGFPLFFRPHFGGGFFINRYCLIFPKSQ
jgi:hypothetical protein